MPRNLPDVRIIVRNHGHTPIGQSHSVYCGAHTKTFQDGWYWHLVERELRSRGRETVAPDLPCEDDTAGLSEYTETVVAAAGARGAIVCTEDRFFPAGFMRRVAAERLGIVPDEIAAGHCVALSRPRELADMLDGYAARPGGPHASTP